MNYALRALALIVASSLPLAAVSSSAATIPVEAFFKKSVTTGAMLSPNGRFVAIRTQSKGGRSMLTLVDVAKQTSRVLVNYRNADVDSFFWVNDGRLAFTIVNVDHEGEAGKPGLYAIDRDGKNLEFLLETVVRKRSFAESDLAGHNPDSEIYRRGFPLAKGEFIEVLAQYPDNGIEGGGASVVRINTANGRHATLDVPHGTFGWLFDSEGRPRIATAKRGKRVITFYLDKREWRQIDERDENSEPRFEPVLYVDGRLYVRSRNGKDESAIYPFDLEKNTILPDPLISAPGFDIDGYFILSDQKMLGYRYFAETTATVWFDPHMKAIQQEVDRLFPGMVNKVSRGRSSETPYVLIENFSDIESRGYFLYNTETKQRIFLGESMTGMPADKMAPRSMARYTARDGLRIPAFLTLPKGVAPKKLPTVVLVGSKAERRNHALGWDPEAQFLASRGYAVLQPEPRGVSGFGHAHRQAGKNQAGMAVQDDIADAVKWAVAQGHTDPDRVCIAGTDYGGYAAMMAMLRNAAVFKCGISWSGLTTYQNNPDDEKLKTIRRPVLLAYGTDDQTVKHGHALAFYQAIKAGNPQAEWLEYTPTVEDWKTQKNRIDLWKQIEAFLAKHIGTKQADSRPDSP
jgi:dipeptidyl aminopeptidase/acylaminoacyl peptidase